MVSVFSVFNYSQGFFLALRLVAACQSGKDPSVGSIVLADPPPRLVGIDSSTLASLTQNKWTIDVRPIEPSCSNFRLEVVWVCVGVSLLTVLFCSLMSGAGLRVCSRLLSRLVDSSLERK